jgi:nicotinamide-nucleotide amidase
MPPRAHTTAILLKIGDELLSGDILDRNGATLAARLRVAGVRVLAAETIPDDEDAIVAAVHRAARADVCLVSGGLGPTTDDLTAGAIARAAGLELVRVPEVEDALRARFGPYLERYAEKHGEEVARGLIERNLVQADLPQGCTVLDNPIGTAVGFAVEVRGSTGPCWVAAMPGVPTELGKMLDEQVLPRVRERFALSPIDRRVYRVLGDGESAVQQRIDPVLARIEEDPVYSVVVVHYRAHTPEILVNFEARPTADGAGASGEALAALDPMMREALGRSLYGVGDLELVDRVVRTLARSGLTLATAESCTGGGIGQEITAVPGSSSCFLGGIIAYANDTKMRQLGVPAALLDAHGAVSEPVAVAMAEGARAALGSDLAVGITGVAGPGGGSPDKPVGTVHVAVSGVGLAPGAPDGSTEPLTLHRRLSLRGNRGRVRRSATVWALGMIWDALRQLDLATLDDPPPISS